MGEKLSDLEQFYPERMANRILGMGDVLSLIEKAQESLDIDEDKEKEMAARVKKGKMDFNDYLESMKQMRNMGGMGSILSMMGMNTAQLDDPVQSDFLVKLFSHVYGILTCHNIHNENGLMHRNFFFDFLKLRHHIFISTGKP